MRSRGKARVKKLEQELERQLARKNPPVLPVDKVEFFDKVLKLKLYPYQAESERYPSPLKTLRCSRKTRTTERNTAPKTANGSSFSHEITIKTP